MNRYETIFIVDADVGVDDQKVIFERAGTLIDDKQATLLLFDDWGVKKLAYEIKKKKQGHYVRLDFCGNGELVNEIERMFRHDHRILRFMTVRLETDVDPAALKAGMEVVDEPAETPAEAPAKTNDGDKEDAGGTPAESPPKTTTETTDQTEASSDETEKPTDTSDKE
ncbi:MAG: 30S ribosomal protein S6 [Deltaproteobacteria bacterium]|nr:30S ribosomal protein S6 [Deltaproteobacteria bacterium]